MYIFALRLCQSLTPFAFDANAFPILDVSKRRLRCFFLPTIHVRIELSPLD
jgi:hypothetical protein